MQIERKIFEKIVKGEEFPIASGELVVKTKLSKVVAGVNIYDIVLKRHDDEPDLSFESVEQLMDYASGNGDGTDFHICSECGDIPEAGFYIDNETGDEYCSFECLLQGLNSKYGLFNWNTMLGDSDSFEVYVKISEEEATELEDYKKVSGQYWRRADIEYICPFGRKEDKDDCFGDIEFTEVDDVIL